MEDRMKGSAVVVLVGILALFVVPQVNAQRPRDCCLPSTFTSDYTFFGNEGPVVAYEGQLWHSSEHGLRMDAHLWDPHSPVDITVWYLKSGDYYLYNVTGHTCIRTDCAGCFHDWCVGPNTNFRFKQNVTVGSQVMQRWTLANTDDAILEVTVVPYNRANCLPVNELQEYGINLAAETTYVEGFFKNVRVNPRIPTDKYDIPTVCSTAPPRKLYSRSDLPQNGFFLPGIFSI